MSAEAVTISKPAPSQSEERLSALSARRLAMPVTAEIVDEFRKVFGPPVAIKATEGNESVNWVKTTTGDLR